MIFKSIPGRVVQKRVRKPGGGHRIKAWFKFDENGFAEIDETKVTNPDMVKLKTLFKVVESKEVVENLEVNYGLQEKDEEETEVDEEEIRNKAKEAGIKSWHIKSIERLIKELEELEVI